MYDVGCVEKENADRTMERDKLYFWFLEKAVGMSALGVSYTFEFKMQNSIRFHLFSHFADLIKYLN